MQCPMRNTCQDPGHKYSKQALICHDTEYRPSVGALRRLVRHSRENQLVKRYRKGIKGGNEYGRKGAKTCVLSPADSPVRSLQTDGPHTHSHMQSYLCCRSSPADTQIDLTMGPSALNQAVVSVRVGDFPSAAVQGKQAHKHTAPPFLPMPVINKFSSSFWFFLVPRGPRGAVRVPRHRRGLVTSVLGARSLFSQRRRCHSATTTGSQPKPDSEL